MRTKEIVSWIAVTAFFLASGTFAPVTAKAAEPTNKEKIVGTWEFVKSTEKNPPPAGSTVEFTKDGKVKMTITIDDKKMTLEGTYTLDGDTLKIVGKSPDGKETTETMKIVKLTDKELVTEGKMPGNTGTTELKKK